MSSEILDKCEFYCVAYNSPERKATMTARFAQMGLPLNVHDGVQMDDARLQFTDELPFRRLASVFYGHLDNVAAFYATGKPYGLFCEDDVHIRRDLAEELPTIIREFEQMKLEVLLLGYMTADPIEWWTWGCPLVYDPGAESDVPYRYHRYHNDLYGVHLFMISRKYARRLLDTYGPDYAARAHLDPALAPYNPDWTLSKLSVHRALRFPMMAVEDGKGHYDHWGQGEFHRISHLANYRAEEFL